LLKGGACVCGTDCCAREACLKGNLSRHTTRASGASRREQHGVSGRLTLGLGACRRGRSRHMSRHGLKACRGPCKKRGAAACHERHSCSACRRGAAAHRPCMKWGAAAGEERHSYSMRRRGAVHWQRSCSIDRGGAMHWQGSCSINKRGAVHW